MLILVVTLHQQTLHLQLVAPDRNVGSVMEEMLHVYSLSLYFICFYCPATSQ